MLTVAEMLETYQPVDGDYRPRVGFEYEVHLFDARTRRPLDYPSLRRVLEAAASLTDGTIVQEPVISKVKLPNGALLSLEPGGQFEYSSIPEETFGGCLAQLRFFRWLLDRLRSRFDLHVFYGGLDPVHAPDEIGLVVANDRYRIMNDYFPRVGQMGRRMMRQSCSVQVTFDYQNPAIGAELLQTAFYLSPFAGALFCNAPYLDGQPTGYRSYRTPIWSNTDPSRTGLLPNFGNADFEDYLRFVLAAPMFFVRTPRGGLVDAHGMTFEHFNKYGFEGRAANIEDFVLHNSTIFTDVRLKNTVELRCIDGQDPSLVPAVIAFMCGLLLCGTARTRTRRVLESIPAIDYSSLPDQLAREGISGCVAWRPVRDLLLELIDVARQGLTGCFPDGVAAGVHLESIRALAERGRTPADEVLDRFANASAWLNAGRTFADGELPGSLAA